MIGVVYANIEKEIHALSARKRRYADTDEPGTYGKWMKGWNEARTSEIVTKKYEKTRGHTNK